MMVACQHSCSCSTHHVPDRSCTQQMLLEWVTPQQSTVTAMTAISGGTHARDPQQHFTSTAELALTSNVPVEPKPLPAPLSSSARVHSTPCLLLACRQAWLRCSALPHPAAGAHTREAGQAGLLHWAPQPCAGSRGRRGGGHQTG
jgi:hypothetical protein